MSEQAKEKEMKEKQRRIQIKAEHYNVLKDKHVLAIWFFQNVYVTESVRERARKSLNQQQQQRHSQMP